MEGERKPLDPICYEPVSAEEIVTQWESGIYGVDLEYRFDPAYPSYEESRLYPYADPADYTSLRNEQYVALRGAMLNLVNRREDDRRPDVR